MTNICSLYTSSYILHAIQLPNDTTFYSFTHTTVQSAFCLDLVKSHCCFYIAVLILRISLGFDGFRKFHLVSPPQSFHRLSQLTTALKAMSLSVQFKHDDNVERLIFNYMSYSMNVPLLTSRPSVIHHYVLCRKRIALESLESSRNVFSGQLLPLQF